MKQLELKGATVVITGASSGIGRATALAFAREQASLVLAARNRENLEETVRDCEELGAAAIAVSTNVCDADAVAFLAKKAVDTFGRIDVWVNNAGIGAVGSYSEAPLAAHIQVVETNLLGPMHGAYVALKQFKQQGAGVLINLNSLGAWLPLPYAASYSASKFGLRGFMDALRGETKGNPGIRICDVHPSFVDTPGFRHAANYSGSRIKPLAPLIDPDRVAGHVVKLARSPQDKDPIGWPVAAGRSAFFLAPVTTLRLIKAFMDLSFRFARPAPRTDGTIFQPRSELSRSRGGWRSTRSAKPLPWLAFGLIAGIAWVGLPKLVGRSASPRPQ